MPVQDFLNIFLPLVLLVGAIWIFIRISKGLRKGGGSMTTTVSGATDVFYDREKKRAIEYMVEKKAGKKMKEQSSENTGDEKI